MDVKTAFLYSNIKEEIYIEFPEDIKLKFGNAKDYVLQLKKAFYRLKQAPRVWYHTLAAYLRELGFQPITADLSVFTRGKTFIAVYVDDLLVVGFVSDDIIAVKRVFYNRFKMSDLSSISHYFGIKITRDRVNRTLSLGQTAYIDKILETYGIANSKE